MDEFEAGIYQDSLLEVSVELVDSDPGIWRLLEVRGSLTLDKVHQVLQAAFGWEGAYQHRSVTIDPSTPVRPIRCQFPEFPQWFARQECQQPGDSAGKNCTLERLLALGSGRAFYEYEFGDSWLHRLELVSCRPVNESSPLAKLTDGAWRGPLEGRLGVPCYEEILDMIVYRPHLENAERSAWAAKIANPYAPLDRALIDIAALNHALAKHF